MYIDGFRNPGAAREIVKRIADLAGKLDDKGRKVNVMEVCGSHTMAIARFGIRDILPENIDLISGPGCPVCVTDSGYVDAAIELAEKGAIVVTFGDMINVPGSETSLAEARSKGASIEVGYSPAEALKLAEQNPEREVVFLAIGFETTTGPVVSIVDRAKQRGLENVSLLTSFKLVPPALEALMADSELKIDAFLCPAHVSAIIGSDAYIPYTGKDGVPCVVAGFEPLDILLGLAGILEQIVDGRSDVENQYSRVVKPEGNKKARSVMEKYLEPVDAPWRGLGNLPLSGLGLRAEYAQYDAEKKLSVKVAEGKVPAGCLCGDVIKGKNHPPECKMFGTACTPDNPVGPCMVSSEGSCAAYYKYSRLNSGVGDQEPGVRGDV
ncbi:hydrogenase formation protein HypD [bacterium B17]|nr:hydrogenase formation protein HypD [bacterium B17]